MAGIIFYNIPKVPVTIGNSKLEAKGLENSLKVPFGVLTFYGFLNSGVPLSF